MIVEKINIWGGKDPTKAEQLAAFKELIAESRKKYLNTWRRFVNKYKIRIGKPPSENNIYEFFEKSWNAGKAHSTLKSWYSHINMGVQELYGEKLGKVNTSFC